MQINGIVDDRPAPAKVLEQSDLAADRRGFSYALEPLLKDTTLLFTLTDTDGIRSRDPVRLALVPLPDQPPQLAVQLDGIGTAVTPQARMPAVGRITDDYGIGRVWFEHAVDQQKPAQPRDRRVRRPTPTDFQLADAALEVRELGAEAGPEAVGERQGRRPLRPGPRPERRQQRALAAGRGHARAVAGDAGSARTGVAAAVRAMIQEMTETRDLLARLERRSAGGRARPKRPIRPKSRPATAGKGREPGDDEPADSPARQRTLRLLRVQGALTNCRKSTQEVLGVAEAFDDIRKQLSTTASTPRN